MDEMDDAFDAMILIMALAIFLPIMIFIAVPFLKGDVGGFGVQIEKTALETKGKLTSCPPPPLTTDDIMLMLVVADSNVPQPQKIRLNTTGSETEMAIDSNFFVNRAANLQKAKSVMPTNMYVDLKLFTGTSNPRFWSVEPLPTTDPCPAP